jgi:hypothetical protein
MFYYKATLTREDGQMRVQLPDESSVVGGDQGGLLENNTSMNNEEAQSLLEEFADKEDGEHFCFVS